MKDRFKSMTSRKVISSIVSLDSNSYTSKSIASSIVVSRHNSIVLIQNRGTKIFVKIRSQQTRYTLGVGDFSIEYGAIRMRELSVSVLVLTLLISGCASVNGPTVGSEPAPIESSKAETVEESNTEDANEVSEPRRERRSSLPRVIRWVVLGLLGISVITYLEVVGTGK